MGWSRPFLRRVNRGVGAALRRLTSVTDRTAPAPLTAPWRRILLVKLVGMGDAVLVRSLAEHLHGLLPEAEIGVLGGPATCEVLGVNSSFTVHRYDPAGADRGLRSAVAKIREIRAQSYDVVVDFEQHIVLVALFLWLARIPFRVGLAASDNPRARFQTHTLPLSGSDSMWGAYVNLIRVVAPSLATISTVPLPCATAVRNQVARWWQTNNLDGRGRIVGLHLGSGSRAAARRWPVPRFVQLAERLRAAGDADAIVLTGTSAERPLIDEFVAAFAGRVVDATGLGSIERTADVLSRCALVVSNDTGVMHLAAAMGTPTVGLFGPNSPRRYAPIGPRAVAVYSTRVPCSPCIQVHKGIVPECFHPEKGRCLLDIDVDTVLREARHVLQAGADCKGRAEVIRST